MAKYGVRGGRKMTKYEVWRARKRVRKMAKYVAVV
jgi:hypothetical protein